MLSRESLQKEEVTVVSEETSLEGILTIPEDAESIVLFAHGSGSSRLSPRNQFVAEKLNDSGLSTLLFDLLTPEEHKIDERTRELRFNMNLLSKRLTGAVDWVAGQSRTKAMKIGLFGASTGAAAALMTSVERSERVGAVVSRGGRPDLAGDALPQVQVPVLLIVGGNDPTVYEMNRDASQQLQTEYSIEVVPGASHLFEEPGKLEEVARLACEWFNQKL